LSSSEFFLNGNPVSVAISTFSDRPVALFYSLILYQIQVSTRITEIVTGDAMRLVFASTTILSPLREPDLCHSELLFFSLRLSRTLYGCRTCYLIRH